MKIEHAARETLARHQHVGVVMHSRDENYRFIDAKILLNWGFALPLEIPGP